MAEQNNSIINLGELAEPAKILVEKVSDAVGGIFKPYQIRRVAEAEAAAEKIKAVSRIEISELQQRAMARFVSEEASKQKNIEDITQKAIGQLGEGADPSKIEKDWIVDFFDKARLVSDEEMQQLWAKLLAGEANHPGTFSKRTVHLVASLDKTDAHLFNKLSSYVVDIDGIKAPIVFELEDDLYKNNEISFGVLKHLDSIGLISLDSFSGYKKSLIQTKKLNISYNLVTIEIEFPNENNNSLDFGHVIFSSAGQELLEICKPEKIEGFAEFINNHWNKNGNISKIVVP